MDAGEPSNSAGPPSGGACVPPAPRIWRLTPEQVEASVSPLVPGVRVAERLRITLPARGENSFGNEAARNELGLEQTRSVSEAASTIAERAIEAGGPAAACAAPDAPSDCVRSFLTSFGARAWRRPLAEEEVTRYAAFFSAERDQSDATVATYQLLRALFMSPHFLFRTELGDGAAPSRLSPFEVASALSYLITNGPPDSALSDAAMHGQLSTPAHRLEQANRLLQSPSSAAGVRRFMDYYTHASAVTSAGAKDATLYPEYSPALAADFAHETSAFVDEVMWASDGTFKTLLTGGFSMLNRNVASVYGISAGDTWAKTPLDPSQRAGFLTQASTLARLSTFDEGSIVRRGVFVRTQILCEELPPPPPNLNVALPPPDGVKTRRARLEQHSQAACAGCHSLIDPIGFAFEHYDAIGRYGETELGQPIDSSGELTTAAGEVLSYRNAIELSSGLADSAQAKTCFVRKFATYATGTRSEATDPCTVELLDSFTQSGGKIMGLVTTLVGRPDFDVRVAVSEVQP
jgi:hypothetical protein